MDAVSLEVRVQMKKSTCIIGAATVGTVLRMDLVQYRSTRSTWKLAQQYQANINAVSGKRQRGLMGHELAISQIQMERDSLVKLLRRLWWLDRLRMRLWLWYVDDMIEQLQLGSVHTVYYRQVG